MFRQTQMVPQKNSQQRLPAKSTIKEVEIWRINLRNMECVKFNMLCCFLGVQYHVEEFRCAGPSLPTAVGFGNFFETWDVEKGGSITSSAKDASILL